MDSRNQGVGRCSSSLCHLDIIFWSHQEECPSDVYRVFKERGTTETLIYETPTLTQSDLRYDELFGLCINEHCLVPEDRYISR